jgi:hypothetical protein
MVAVVAEKVTQHTQQHSFPAVPGSAPMRHPRRARIAYVGCDDPRDKPRKQVALKCWMMRDAESVRGWAMDVSETGARVQGAGYRWKVGEKILFKVVMTNTEPSMIVRAKVVRVGDNDVGLRFLEVSFDDWFRLARFCDKR